MIFTESIDIAGTQRKTYKTHPKLTLNLILCFDRKTDFLTGKKSFPTEPRNLFGCFFLLLKASLEFPRLPKTHPPLTISFPEKHQFCHLLVKISKYPTCGVFCYS